MAAGFVWLGAPISYSNVVDLLILHMVQLNSNLTLVFDYLRVFTDFI